MSANSSRTRKQIATKPSQRFGTPTVECPRGGNVRQFASAEERATKTQKTTIHFDFMKKVHGLPFSTTPQQHNTSFAEGRLPLLVYVAGALRNGKLGIPWRFSVFLQNSRTPDLPLQQVSRTFYTSKWQFVMLFDSTYLRKTKPAVFAYRIYIIKMHCYVYKYCITQYKIISQQCLPTLW